jgi:hypothetical protein
LAVGENSDWIGALLRWLEDTDAAVYIAQSDWAFPIIETIHVIAIALVIGTVSVVDLRILGWASAGRPYRQIAIEVLPWTWAAFCAAVLTGGLLFASQATEYFGNTAFRIKLILLALAGINMMTFEFVIARDPAWDRDVLTSRFGKIAAAISLTLWISIVFFGRRIGFTMAPG